MGKRIVKSNQPQPNNIVEKQLIRVSQRLEILESSGGGGLIDTSGFVKTTGDQTINGIKTFIQSPVVPTPILDADATSKYYVDTGDANLQINIDNIADVPMPVSEGMALVSMGANEYKWSQMDTSDSSPMSIGYFNSNAHKSEQIGIMEFAGAFPVGTDNPKLIVEAYLDAVNTDILNPIVELEDGDHFLQYFDSSIGGNPILWVYDELNDIWTYYNTLSLNPGQWFEVLNFVTNWGGISITELKKGTLTWTLASTGLNNFLYEQFNVQGSTGIGGYPPDEVTITLTSTGKLQVIDYVSLQYLNNIVGDIESLILAI